jgi:small conductance mechanosensitive channel
MATSSAGFLNSTSFWDPNDPFSINWLALYQNIVTSIVNFVGRFLIALLLLVVGWLAISLLLFILRHVLRARKFDSPVVNFIVMSIGLFLKSMLIISCIDLLGVQVLSFSAFFAAFGIGVGASVSGAIQNFFAGLMLIVHKAHVVGDWVLIDNGIEGEIATIGVTHSSLKTAQNQHITVPNADLIARTVTNFSKEKQMRCDVTCTIRHSEDVDLVRNLFFELCAAHEQVLAMPKPVMRVTEVTSDGLQLSFRAWCLSEDYWPLFSSLREELKVQFECHGVQFQTARIEVESTQPGDVVRGYRCARPTAEVLAKLDKLSEMWDVMVDAVDVVKKKAEAHHSRISVRKPLKMLRRKFIAQASDSSEEASERVERVKNFSKTALQTQADRNRTTSQLQFPHRRRAKKIIPKPEIAVTSASSDNSLDDNDSNDDDDDNNNDGKRAGTKSLRRTTGESVLSAEEAGDWDLEQLHSLLTSSRTVVEPDGKISARDNLMTTARDKGKISARDTSMLSARSAADLKAISDGGVVQLAATATGVASAAAAPSKRALSDGFKPANTLQVPTQHALSASASMPKSVRFKQELEDDAERAALGQEMSTLRIRGEKGDDETPSDGDADAEAK